MEHTSKRKIAFVVDFCEEKGFYSFERVAVLAQALTDESVYIFLKGANDGTIRHFTERNLTPVLFDSMRELPKVMRNLQIDCLIYDGKNTTVEQVESLRPFCQTIVHFDDFGEGAKLVDCNIIAQYEELHERLSSNMLCGSYAFAVSDQLLNIQASYTSPPLDAVPHIVVAFEDGDPGNLTYRTLRHLTQLHIPLQISIVIDDHYSHSIEPLQLMTLSRRQTNLIHGANAFYDVLPEAHIVICNAGYTPYKVATLGIPCIAAAQHERELTNAFIRESNGIIQLGLGRKMKQSHIQNAVMELILHDSRRERAIKKQRDLQIATNNEVLHELVHNFAYGLHNIAHN